MKKIKCMDGKSRNLPVIVVVVDARVYPRDTEVKEAFFDAVKQKYGSGYGIRYGEGICVGSVDSNTVYNGKGALLKSAGIYPVGDDMIADFKKKWNDVVESFPDPEFRDELVKMETRLTKSPSAFPIIFLLNYSPDEKCFCEKPLSREEHNTVLQNIIARYNISKQNVDAVFVDTQFEDDNIYNPETLPAEFLFGTPNGKLEEKRAIPCKVFHSLDELKVMLLSDEVFDVDKLNEKK